MRQRLKNLALLRQAAIAETPYFFVYGSLMQRFRNFNRFIRRHVLTVQPAYCRGFLYHLPMGFPGLIYLEDCPDLVVGELMTFRNPVRIMKVLDQLEGYAPDNRQRSVYIRRRLPVVSEVISPMGDANRYEESDAWVYTYPLEHLSPSHREELFISCGNWRLFSETPPPSHRRRISLLTWFNRMRRNPERKHVSIEPVLCTPDQPLADNWHESAACSRFCKNAHLCRANRRKHTNNFS
ncbi:MAG: gamma-glutamylcyclotransferase [Deltaproteobacteria bacterium]|nr:gamma-glutamylcyclotransferase [Candidatus Anaeroferrophillacea bacterium]